MRSRKPASEYRAYNTEWTKQWRLNNREKHMVRVAKNTAKKQQVPFDITPEDIVIPEKCPILGISLAFSEGYRKDNTPSLDKIIPKEGYIKSNIQIISWKANKLKNNASLDELILIGKWAENELSKR